MDFLDFWIGFFGLDFFGLDGFFGFLDWIFRIGFFWMDFLDWMDSLNWILGLDFSIPGLWI